ncbi:putative F-box domain, FBD domain, leucine-rich repeat domain superfamily [Dioscorea sansibarensis]
MERPSEKQKHSSGSDGFDRCISKLPDNLLLRILSLLQMKDQVRTGCLSTRWKNLWKSVSNIDFTQTNMHRTPELIAAIDKTLSYHDGLRVIREFRVNAESDLCPMVKVGSWIDFVVRHNIEVLYLDLTPHNLEDKNPGLPLIPARVFQSKSLTGLTLKFGLIKLPPKFCLASLKTLYFEGVVFDDEELASLLINCPVLKDLTLKNCNRGTTLTIVAENSQLENLDIDEDSSDEADDITEFEIFAPNLLTLNFFGKPKRSKYIAMNLESLVSVNFNFLYPSKFTAFWKTQLILYGKLLEDFWAYIDGFLHAKVLKLSCWCAMSLSFQEILGISGSPYDSVTDLTFETEFWKCNLSGLVYVLRYFSKLEVLTINVMRNHDNKSGDFLEEEKRGIKAYWKPDDSSVFGLQQHLKTVKINGFLGSSDTSAEFETTTKSILDARDTEFVFVKFLLKNLTELETMIITTTEELNNFPALKKVDILFQLFSKLLAFPRSSTKAQVLLHPDQLTDA